MKTKQKSVRKPAVKAKKASIHMTPKELRALVANERKQLVFQLGAMGEISRETAYNSLGIDDVVAEQKKRLEEDLEIQRAVIADRRAEQLAEALQVCNAEQRISTLKQLISLL